MKKLKILHVAPGYIEIPPNKSGAVETVIYNLSENMIKRGHEVHIINISSEEKTLVKSHAKFHYVWNPPINNIGKRFNLLRHIIRGLSYCIFSSIELNRLLKNERFDVVHVHDQFSSLTSTLIAHKHKVPVIFTVHSFVWVWGFRSFLHKLSFWPEVKTMQLADKTICLTEDFKSNITKTKGIDKNKLEVIPNGISIPKRDGSIKVDENLMICVARIAPYKNQIRLAQAFKVVLKNYPKMRLYLIGPISDEKYYNQIKKYIAKNSLDKNIEFLGDINKKQLDKIYREARISILPSLGEGLPLALLESLSYGKTVIASDIAPHREILKMNKNAFILVNPNKERDISARILKAINSKKMGRVFGENSVKLAKCFDWKKVSKEMEKVYLGVKR